MCRPRTLPRCFQSASPWPLRTAMALSPSLDSKTARRSISLDSVAYLKYPSRVGLPTSMDVHHVGARADLTRLGGNNMKAEDVVASLKRLSSIGVALALIAGTASRARAVDCNGALNLGVSQGVSFAK